MDKKRLMIIDGNSLLHRAYHALPPLATKDGVYTNGVYGFLTMLYKVLDEYEPNYICVAFDNKKPTFRHKEFQEYKAGRAKTPDELGMQFPLLKEVLDKLKIYRIEVEGFEADDIAGTLASIGEENNLDVIAVSGDKDYLQLASDKTKILITRKGISNLEIYDDKAVIERYELTPEQFIDLKGLMGDKSDNIPGVPGIGEKTGIKLLKDFNSMEGIYENLDKISGKKLKENLIDYRQQAFLSKRLAKIITNIPLDFNIDYLERQTPNQEELFELYSRLEFRSLLNKINGPKDNIDSNQEASRESKEISYEIAKEKDDFTKIKKEADKTKKLGIRFLTEGIHPLKDKVIGVAVNTGENIYYTDFYDNNDLLRDFMDVLKDTFESESIAKLGHNLKNEILVLLKSGVKLEGIDFDSMVGQYLIDPAQNDYSIKNLAMEYLHESVDKIEDLLGSGKGKKSYGELTLDERATILCNEISKVFQVEEIIKTKITDQDMEELYCNVELPLIEVLANMEYVGFTVDIQKLEDIGEELDKKINKLTEEIYEFSQEKFNINSPKQLGYILFEKLDLTPIKKTKTGYSTNAEVLEKLMDKHPIIEKILEYRQLGKLKSTYIDGLLNLVDKETKKVHSSFNQTITTTGRISSTEPNLQNIPIKTEEGRKIRKVFIAKDSEHVLVDADYSQIELRVLAHISDDEKLKEAFFSEEDIHRKTASEVFGVSLDEVSPIMRSRAKAVNFGIVYGISDYGLSRDLNISMKEAKTYIDNYLANYKKVKEYMEDIIDFGKKKGYVETILKRRRYLPDLNSRNFNVRSFAERMAMNTPIQGSAADIIKVAMVSVFNELKKRGLRSRLILQVHDELIIEAHKEEIDIVQEILKTQMESSIELSVPLKVDMEIGDSWYDTK